jgi:putative redox protein
MVRMTAVYRGEKHCELVHGPSNSKIETDAPRDNAGRGEKFSPTDLVGAALVSCILTTMAIVADRDGVELAGATGEVVKEMLNEPRRVGSLNVRIVLPAKLDDKYRKKMENVAYACPVHKALHPDIQSEIEFQYI